MRIVVKAKPRAREEKVEQLTQPSLGLSGPTEPLIYKVSVKEPPTDNRANEAIVRALARHFKVTLSHVRIVSGHTNKQKLVEIDLGNR